VSWCPDCDPILRAGFIRCRVCGIDSYPADAEWVSGGLIIATYPPACGHRAAAMTWVVDPAKLASAEPRCEAATQSGARCRNTAKRDGLCAVHIAQRFRRRARRAGA